MSDQTTILLIRHGQTEWNAQGRWQGHADVPLNEVGRQQARALARRLAAWPIRAIYASDLQRAAETAVILGQMVGLSPQFDPEWRERDVGEFSGLTGDETRQRYPEVWQGMKRGAINPPNGETHDRLAERAIAAFRRTLARHEGEMAAIISHGGTLAAVVTHVLGLPMNSYGRFSLRGNTGLSIVVQDDRGAYLSLLNDASHLSHIPISIPQPIRSKK